MPTLHLFLEPGADQRCQARLPGSAAILLHRKSPFDTEVMESVSYRKSRRLFGGFAAACRRADEMVGTDFEIL
jgi:hypothetical protein